MSERQTWEWSFSRDHWPSYKCCGWQKLVERARTSSKAFFLEPQPPYSCIRQSTREPARFSWYTSLSDCSTSVISNFATVHMPLFLTLLTRPRCPYPRWCCRDERVPLSTSCTSQWFCWSRRILRTLRALSQDNRWTPNLRAIFLLYALTVSPANEALVGVFCAGLRARA